MFRLFSPQTFLVANQRVSFAHRAAGPIHSPQHHHPQHHSEQQHQHLTITSPLQEYNRLVKHEQIRDDSHQRQTVQLLDRLFDSIRNYDPPLPVPAKHTSTSTHSHGNTAGWFSMPWQSNKKPAINQPNNDEEEYEKTPKGLYLYGDVGTGKTFLMDLFYDRCHFVKRRRRVHFHAFMIDVHKRIHRWRISKREPEDHDPIPPLADALVTQAWLLCFDEFQVNDVADASILNRLFRGLYKRGAVVVSTSNRAPQDLYQNGLQRELFVPFIHLVGQRNTVHSLNSGIDYRLTGVRSTTAVYLTNDKDGSQLKSLFRQLIGDAPVSSVSLPVYSPTSSTTTSTTTTTNDVVIDSNRAIRLNRVAKRVGFFTFDELCKTNVGAAEYIAIANNLNTVFVSDIPKLSINERNEARRFITLIDELYEHKVKFICNAASEPKDLFSLKQVDEEMKKRRDDVRTSANRIHSQLQSEFLEKKGVGDLADTILEADTLFSGDEESFMFARAASRLIEMQSSQYLSSKWRGNPWIDC